MKPLRSSVTARRLAVGAVAALGFLAAPLVARAQVFQQVPSDAMVVIQIKNLQATGKKLGDLSQKLGFAQMNPAAADPLTALKQKLNWQKGLDETKDAAIVVPNVWDQKKNEPAALVLVPVTDYKQFLENFENPRPQGDMTVVKMANDPDDSYIVNWGNYAAIGSMPEAVAKKPDGMTPQGQAAQQLQSKDIVAYVNMKSARNRILPAITQGRAKMIAGFEKEMQKAGGAAAAGEGEPATTPGQRNRRGAGAAGGDRAAMEKQLQQFSPLMKAFINRGLDVVEQVVRDTDAATYGVEFADTGIKPTWLVEFAAGSPSAQRLGQFKATDQSLLNGLPQGKYLFFGGAQIDGKALSQLISDFAAPLQPQFAGLGEKGQAIQQYLTAMQAMTASLQGQSFGFVTPSGQLGQDAIFQMVAVNRGDAKAMAEAQRQAFNSQQAIMDALMPAQAGAQMKTTFTANAKTVDGVSLNQLSTSFATPPGQQQTPQQAQMQQMMTFMYGPGGMNLYTGAVNDNTLIAAQGASDQLLQQLVAAAKANQDVLSKEASLQPTQQQLPQQRLAAFYVGLDQIATTVANYAKAFGMPINFQLPPDLPPLGFSIGTNGSALQGDGFIPTQTIQSIVAAGMQTYMQMQGGQGGQQPGGAGGGL